jgi:hypothetical protein
MLKLFNNVLYRDCVGYSLQIGHKTAKSIPIRRTLLFTNQNLMTMRNLAFLCTAALLIFSLTNCRSAKKIYRPDINTEAGQIITYKNGAPCITQTTNAISITAQLQYLNRSEANLILAVRNDSDSILTFFPEQVSAKGFNKLKAGQSLVVMSPKDVIRRQNKNIALATGLLVATTAAAVAINIDEPNSHNNYHNFGYDPFLYWWLIPAVAGPRAAPNPLPDGVIQSQDGLLRTHTLQPGEELRGIIKIKCRPGFAEPLEIRIPIDGKDEVFLFNGLEKVW